MLWGNLGTFLGCVFRQLEKRLRSRVAQTSLEEADGEIVK